MFYIIHIFFQISCLLTLRLITWCIIHFQTSTTSLSIRWLLRTIIHTLLQSHQTIWFVFGNVVALTTVNMGMILTPNNCNLLHAFPILDFQNRQILKFCNQVFVHHVQFLRNVSIMQIQRVEKSIEPICKCELCQVLLILNRVPLFSDTYISNKKTHHNAITSIIMYSSIWLAWNYYTFCNILRLCPACYQFLGRRDFYSIGLPPNRACSFDDTTTSLKPKRTFECIWKLNCIYFLKVDDLNKRLHVNISS